MLEIVKTCVSRSRTRFYSFSDNRKSRLKTSFRHTFNMAPQVWGKYCIQQYICTIDGTTAHVPSIWLIYCWLQHFLIPEEAMVKAWQKFVFSHGLLFYENLQEEVIPLSRTKQNEDRHVHLYTIRLTHISQQLAR